VSHLRGIYHGNAVRVVAAVVPSTRSIFAHWEHLRLEAIFAAVCPCVLCVPLAILANESFPLGFAMAPTERSKLDEILAEFVQDLGIPHYTDKPILNDEGCDFPKSARQHPRHFLCHRHVLEGSGSAIHVARIVHRFSFSPTKERDCSRAAQTDSESSIDVRIHWSHRVRSSIHSFIRRLSVRPVRSRRSFRTAGNMDEKWLWGVAMQSLCRTASPGIQEDFGRLSVFAARIGGSPHLH
jgi:hypothetical protein